MLKPEVRIIPAFFFSIASPYVVGSSTVNSLPDRALIPFRSESLLGSRFDVVSRIGLVLDASLVLFSLFDAELSSALGTAPGDIVTFGTDLGELPGLDRELGIGLGTKIGTILGTGLGTELGSGLGTGLVLGLGLSVSAGLVFELESEFATGIGTKL